MTLGSPPSVRPVRVVFLDIDGVLQPTSRQKRFDHDLDALRENLAERYGAEYREVNPYDLGAVVHDWNAGAVARLRALCEDHGAKIVVSSDWRHQRSVAQLQALFRLHDLHHLIVDRTSDPHNAPHYRAGEVKEYLDTHPGSRASSSLTTAIVRVHTDRFLDESDALRARQILSGGPVTQENRPFKPLVFQGIFQRANQVLR